MPSSANELGLVPVIFDANREEQKVSAVAFLFRDQHIVTGSRDGCLQVREAKTGKSVGDPWQDKERSEICAIDVSPNGNHVATGSKNGKIRVWIWNGRTAAIVGESKEHSSAALCVRWSRHNNGAHIASGFDDGSIAVWSFTASGLKRPMSTDVTCLQHVTAIDYSHDGTQLIVSGYDCKILILRIDERAQEVRVNKVIKICSNPYHVPCIAWASTADGHAIVTGSTDCKIRMVELPSGLPSECVFEGHSGEVCAIVLSPDKRVLASASHDHTLRLWDLDAKQPIDQPLPHPVKLSCAAFAADGNSVATGTFDGKIYVWDLLSRDVKGREKDANARHPFNPDSQIPATRRPVPRTRQPIKFDSKKFFGTDTGNNVWDAPTGGVSRTGRFSRHVKVAASRAQQTLRVPRTQLERLVSNTKLGGIQEASSPNRHNTQTGTPLDAAFDQLPRETAEPITVDSVRVPRTRLVKFLMRAKCIPEYHEQILD